MQFEDVNASTPHSEDIQWLADNGITEGWVDATGKRTFRGMDTVKRQDMAAFLKRLATKNLGVKDSSYNRNPFADVNKRTPHYKDILWMAGTGVSEGWTEANGTKTYRGMSDVVRQDMAAFLHRLGNYANTGSVKS